MRLHVYGGRYSAHLCHHLNAGLDYVEDRRPHQNSIDSKLKCNLIVLTICVISSLFIFLTSSLLESWSYIYNQMRNKYGDLYFQIENLQEQLRDKDKQLTNLKDRVKSLQTDSSNTDTALATLEEALSEKVSLDYKVGYQDLGKHGWEEIFQMH